MKYKLWKWESQVKKDWKQMYISLIFYLFNKYIYKY